MLSEIFYWVLNISIIGSIAGLVVLALRQVKAIPRSIVYALWFLPLFRFWLPFGIASEYSLLNRIAKFTTKTVLIREGLPQLTSTNSIMGASSYFPIVYKTELLANVFTIASGIWVTVCCAALLTSASLYFITKSDLKSAKFMISNIYESDKITAPAVYGVIRPKIVIPAALVQGDMDYVILHEQAHIRRGDNLFRVVAVITACCHWFNPLTWLFLRCFFTDMELACDARVLQSLNEGEARDYARTILAYSSGKALFASAFGGAKTRVRIENILSYKKLTLLSSLFFALLVMVIVVIIATNAVA